MISKLSEAFIHKACYGSSESCDPIGNLSATSHCNSIWINSCCNM